MASAVPCRTSRASTLGVAFMVGAVGIGLGAVFIAYPVLQTILKYAGAAILLRAVAMSGRTRAGRRRGPMTFWGAAMFQWINAKGWVMVIGTITAYAAIAGFPWNIASRPRSACGGHGVDVVWAFFGTRCGRC